MRELLIWFLFGNWGEHLHELRCRYLPGQHNGLELCIMHCWDVSSNHGRCIIVELHELPRRDILLLGGKWVLKLWYRVVSDKCWGNIVHVLFGWSISN